MSITEHIRPFVRHIQQDAANGDVLAQQVIESHRQFCDSIEDPLSELLCETAFNAWKKSKQPPQGWNPKKKQGNPW